MTSRPWSDLLALYRKGIRKHAKKYAFRVERIYDSIAGQLSRHEKDFRFAALGEEARFREYGKGGAPYGRISFPTDAPKCDILLALYLSDAQGRFSEFRQAV